MSTLAVNMAYVDIVVLHVLVGLGAVLVTTTISISNLIVGAVMHFCGVSWRTETEKLRSKIHEVEDRMLTSSKKKDELTEQLKREQADLEKLRIQNDKLVDVLTESHYRRVMIQQEKNQMETKMYKMTQEMQLLQSVSARTTKIDKWRDRKPLTQPQPESLQINRLMTKLRKTNKDSSGSRWNMPDASEYLKTLMFFKSMIYGYTFSAMGSPFAALSLAVEYLLLYVQTRTQHSTYHSYETAEQVDNDNGLFLSS